MKNQTQLITYVDRLGGDLAGLRALLDGPLAGVFGGVHLLPFFHPIDGADAGFDPIDHTAVDSRLGGWDEVAALGARYDLMVLNAEGVAYWGWSGTETAIHLGGIEDPDAAGAWVFEPLTWVVTARDADGQPLALSESAPTTFCGRTA